MSDYVQSITDSLKKIISDLSEDPSPFLRNPEKDFSRNRKINFKTFIGITMNSGGCAMRKELLDFFDLDVETPTVSAYTQQRAKVLPEAFEYLFNTFTTNNLTSENNYDGYRIIACDGSDLTIATNPEDKETARKSNGHGGITNHLHLNAFYDVLNRLYVTTVVETFAKSKECRACINMMEKCPLDNVILVADRGYENYNLIAHIIQKGWKFVIRMRDISSRGIAASLKLPHDDTFDENVSLTLTRKQMRNAKKKGYKCMSQKQIFDYLPLKSNETYELSFRVARFAITEDSYEMVVTNLDKTSFSSEKLKEIYHLRWGIETSFRELKYAVGLTSFHAKKVDHIKQEIYARLLLYNYCELITTHVIQKCKKTGKTKQVNFTNAIYICREFLRQKRQLSPPDVIKLIEKYILPVRPGRKDPRKIRTQGCISFIYRVA